MFFFGSLTPRFLPFTRVAFADPSSSPENKALCVLRPATTGVPFNIQAVCGVDDTSLFKPTSTQTKMQIRDLDMQRGFLGHQLTDRLRW